MLCNARLSRPNEATACRALRWGERSRFTGQEGGISAALEKRVPRLLLTRVRGDDEGSQDQRADDFHGDDACPHGRHLAPSPPLPARKISNLKDD